MLFCPDLRTRNAQMSRFPVQREVITCQEGPVWKSGGLEQRCPLAFPFFVPALRCCRSKCVKFSPSGTSFAVASTDGLMIYSQDASLTYAPVELSEDVTPDSVAAAISAGYFTQALVVCVHYTTQVSFPLMIRCDVCAPSVSCLDGAAFEPDGSHSTSGCGRT
jgi:hypothetical protein